MGRRCSRGAASTGDGMRRAAAVLLALLTVGGLVSYVTLREGIEASHPPLTSPKRPATNPLLVGFLDDANFRWRPDRAQMLDEARAAGARVVRAIEYWNLVSPKRRPAPRPPPVLAGGDDDLTRPASAVHSTAGSSARTSRSGSRSTRIRQPPADASGVSPDLQADCAAHALDLAAEDPRVKLFVCFTFRDDYTNAWRSGLLDGQGHERPAYKLFATTVHAIDG